MTGYVLGATCQGFPQTLSLLVLRLGLCWEWFILRFNNANLVRNRFIGPVFFQWDHMAL